MQYSCFSVVCINMAVEDVEMKDAKSPEEATEPEAEKKDVNILTLEGKHSET